MKKLQVALAVTTLLGTVAGVQAATVSQSGGTLAMETIIPGSPASPAGNFTRVRAPAVTYSYNNGPNAQANGTQLFHILFTLGTASGGEPRWAFPGSASAEVPGVTPANGVPIMALDPVRTAETIQARLRSATNGRVAVLGNVNPGAGQFAIVLRSITAGNNGPLINGVDPAAHPSTVQTVQYNFELVNNTTQPISLSDLDITFNTSKLQGAVGDYFVGGQNPATPARDFDGTALTATSTSAEYAAIHNLATTGIVATTGNSTAAFGIAACTPITEPRITVRGNSGINGQQGTELNTNTTSTTAPTFNPSYMIIRRVTDIYAHRNGLPDRLVATTNSFPTNFGQNPVNGVGGTGGGRLTFKPTVAATFNNGFNNATTADNNPTLPAPVAGGTIPAANAAIATASSGDERDMALGVVSFRNRAVTASDRLLLSSFYGFSDTAGGTREGDFSTPAVPNVSGGVDVNGNAGQNALTIAVSGMTGSFAAGSQIRIANLAGLPAGQQNCRGAVAAGAGYLLPALPAIAGGAFTIGLSHANLAAAAGATATLNAKDLTICYAIPGNTNVPALGFTGATVIATLLKDDISEQAVTSCPGSFANLTGGVKIDVRNFAMSNATGANSSILGILRVINNSEVDTARVDAQYIWNDGKYGRWGNIVPVLPPRGAVYVTDAQVLGALTNLPTTVAAGDRRDDIPTNALLLASNPAGAGTDVLRGASSIRLRISADVSTLRVQNYIYDTAVKALVEVSGSQGADFVNVESSNRDHIDQDAQTDIKK